MNQSELRSFDKYMQGRKKITKEEREKILEFLNTPDYEKAYHMLLKYCELLPEKTRNEIGVRLREECLLYDFMTRGD